MTEPIHVTDHAYVRGKERLGLGKAAMLRLASRAYDDGRKHREFRGPFRRYLDGLYLSHRAANNIRVHGEVVYLFNERRLVTVVHVPPGLKAGLKVRR